MKNNMYELAKGYDEILAMIYDEDIDEQMILDTLESIEYAIEDKVENTAKVIQELVSDSEKIDKEIERLSLKQKRIDNSIVRLKESIVLGMNKIGKEKIKTDLFNFSIVNNGGKQPMKVEFERVPEEYQKIMYASDTEKIRTALENGIALDFATLLERGKHLNIR